MKRTRLQDEPVDVIHSEESSSSDVETGSSCSVSRPLRIRSTVWAPTRQLSEEERLFRRAETYQLYMKLIPIPTERGSLVPCYSWTGLGKSLKEIYKQPLHYLTNILLKSWDQERIGTKDEDQPLDAIIHPVKAEATIWAVEEVHRLTSSHHYIAQLWLRDPLYQAYIDSVVPKVYSEIR